MEIEGIIRANCIEIEEIPADAKVVDVKWVYDVKINMTTEIVRFKSKVISAG
jgi:hypothetical protein